MQGKELHRQSCISFSETKKHDVLAIKTADMQITRLSNSLG